MRAANEETLVREHGQLSGNINDRLIELQDNINDRLIELQDNAYNLGFKRGQIAALESIEWTSAKGFTFCPSCNYTEQTGHALNCLIGNAINKARGEA